MIPREKAAQLVVDNQLKIKSLDYKEAVECAKVIVDEIIKSREDDGHFDDSLSVTSSEYYTPHPMYLTYWKEVKQELEKL
jgi:hypothetical protein